LLRFQDSLGSNCLPPQGLAACTRMKNADSQDAAPLRVTCPEHERESYDPDSRLHLHTQEWVKNDRSMIACLSKTAHIAESRLQRVRQDQTQSFGSSSDPVRGVFNRDGADEVTMPSKPIRLRPLNWINQS
jgi:hypothetical protein